MFLKKEKTNTPIDEALQSVYQSLKIPLDSEFYQNDKREKRTGKIQMHPKITAFYMSEIYLSLLYLGYEEGEIRKCFACLGLNWETIKTNLPEITPEEETPTYDIQVDIQDLLSLEESYVYS